MQEDEQWEELFMGEEDVQKSPNPFKNLLDFVSYFHGAAERMERDELDAILDYAFAEEKDAYPNLPNTHEFLRTVTDLCVESIMNASTEEWMDFDESALQALLESPFFDEYHATVYWGDGWDSFMKKNPRCLPREKELSAYPRAYGMLEFYTYNKVLAIAAAACPEERSAMLWYFWCYQDIIQYLLKAGFCEGIAKVYNAYGYRWFITSRMKEEPFDPVLYLWGSDAILACRSVGICAEDALKSDLKELLDAYETAVSQTKEDAQMKEIKDTIRFRLEHFKEDEVKNIVWNIAMHEHRSIS